MSFGSIISRARREKGFSQKKLAKMLNVHAKTISNWELNKTRPDKSLCRELCEKLNINLDEVGIETTDDLCSQEQRLLKLYRKLDAESKRLVVNFTEILESYQCADMYERIQPKKNLQRHRDTIKKNVSNMEYE